MIKLRLYEIKSRIKVTYNNHPSYHVVYVFKDAKLRLILPLEVMNLNEIKKNGNYKHIKIYDTLRDIVNHPAFQGFGQHILPWDNSSDYYNTPLEDIGSLLPLHNFVDPDIVVGAINHMIDEVDSGKSIFYDFYTKEQKKEDPAKKSTGLFFFRGEPGRPF
ncbi:MAG: hypothetical protein ACXVH2_10915, partial [Methanobacterium sp.]